MPVLIDTNVLIRYFKDDEPLAEMIDKASSLIVHPAVYAEFLAGIDERTASGKSVRRLLEEFLDAPAVECCSVTPVTGIYYAKIYRHLKASGKMIPKNDIWIAASALEHGWEVYTHDEHFASIPMLQLMVMN